MTETATITATQTAVEAYEEQWATTLQAIRTLARLGKWSKRIVDDSDPEHLRGVIMIYGKHRQVRQAIKVVVLPGEVYLVLYDIGVRSAGRLAVVRVDQTAPLKRGALLHIVRRTVDAWRHVERVESLGAVAA